LVDGVCDEDAGGSDVDAGGLVEPPQWGRRSSKDTQHRAALPEPDDSKQPEIGPVHLGPGAGSYGHPPKPSELAGARALRAPGRFEHAFRVELLDPAVVGISDIDLIEVIYIHAIGPLEGTGRRSRLTPVLQPASRGRELRQPIVEEVRDIDESVRVRRRVPRGVQLPGTRPWARADDPDQPSLRRADLDLVSLVLGEKHDRLAGGGGPCRDPHDASEPRPLGQGRAGARVEDHDTAVAGVGDIDIPAEERDVAGIAKCR